MMMEQQKISPQGILYTRGPGNYKIPGFGDIPVEFNVTLLKGSVNEHAVYSSKVSKVNPYLHLFIYCQMNRLNKTRSTIFIFYFGLVAVEGSTFQKNFYIHNSGC